jgi:glycerate kinase
MKSGMQQRSLRNANIVITGQGRRKAASLVRTSAITFFQKRRKLKARVLAMAALMAESVPASDTA